MTAVAALLPAFEPTHFFGRVPTRQADHTLGGRSRSWAAGACCAFLAAIALSMGGCASRSASPAPIEDRGRPSAPIAQPAQPVQPVQTTAASPAPAVVVTQLPAATTTLPRGAENAGKPGYYTVKPGDTLLRIALDSGQKSRDLVRWNALENPNIIEVGQVLRVIAPGVDAPVASTRPVATVTAIVTAPLATPARVTPTVAGASAPVADSDLSFSWPAKGNIIATFDGERSLGIDIAGKLGDPIIASADGQVIYAGAGLRGYGNFIIVKHNNTFLTAYANNQTLLVKEDQLVRRGQKIAEMGQSDSDKVKLHFEIRRMGKSIDPMKMLPAER